MNDKLKNSIKNMPPPPTIPKVKPPSVPRPIFKQNLTLKKKVSVKLVYEKGSNIPKAPIVYVDMPLPPPVAELKPIMRLSSSVGSS